MSINLSVGTRLPAWATATGRVLLGALDEFKRRERLARSEVAAHTGTTLTSFDDLINAISDAQRDGGYAFTSRNWKQV
ncbi:hypothetical protein HHL24_41280 [Paraburkholderia sp. RP-4-7]|uniref:IclR-ED domain-containing protein n=1 Tax=Paraburkholderia polaris TaxID=2728848 RepID=A0A848IPT2_9BURK|nr:IclR family transcriptional regulator C-terminal domain-containing protein [Paraburkholderia polaris]NMM04272.1 hypothetical protein [Paraburkholderia polaris]